MALADEDLIKLASNLKGFEPESSDVPYYQTKFVLCNGNHAVLSNHLYFHYKKWSSDPVSFDTFLDLLDLESKSKNFILLDEKSCNIPFTKLIGDYVKNKRKSQKEERLRKVSRSKSKT